MCIGNVNKFILLRKQLYNFNCRIKIFNIVIKKKLSSMFKCFFPFFGNKIFYFYQSNPKVELCCIFLYYKTHKYK